MKTVIVITTINLPTLLTDYAADIAAHKHNNVEIFVVGDRKTPPETEAFCRKVMQDSGVPVRWMGIPEQEEMMAEFPELAAHIPWNCGQRRNFGHIRAWLEGFEVIIALDDDNFHVDPDYIGQNLAALQMEETEMVSSDNGWFNCCTMLEEAEGRSFFPRGYPLTMRHGRHGNLEYTTSKKRVVVNAGLWLGDPDIDAATRFAIPIDATALRRTKSLALSPGTWCPFNSQNTALHIDTLPAWFMSPFVGRYEDLWGSYVARACIDKMGDAVVYGKPLVRQDRNFHNLFHDFDLERMGMKITEGFCEALRGANITGKDYVTCAAQAMDALEDWTAHGKLEKEHRQSLEKFTGGYRIWIATFQKLMQQKRPAKLSA